MLRGPEQFERVIRFGIVVKFIVEQSFHGSRRFRFKHVDGVKLDRRMLFRQPTELHHVHERDGIDGYDLVWRVVHALTAHGGESLQRRKCGNLWGDAHSRSISGDVC